ncbi:MAG: flavodoxin, partial [Synergistaceae bacterium]|nr:flavodoxin [Synergistaceae bacterium]
KTIWIICSRGKSVLGRSVSDITQLCPKSTILEGIAIYGSGVKNAQDDVSEWLKNLRMVR